MAALALSRRVAICAAAGVVVGGIVGEFGPWWLGPVAGWDVGSVTLLVWTWRFLWPLDGDRTATHATRESPGRAGTDILLIAGSIFSLIAVGVVFVRASHESGLTRGLLVGLCVASIVLAWSVVHTVYSLRYAKLYYEGRTAAVDFNGDTAPAYSDFAYVALTIGMTFQVSDTDLTTNAMRRLALRHAVLSYMFGTLIIAATINLLAGLG